MRRFVLVAIFLAACGGDDPATETQVFTPTEQAKATPPPPSPDDAKRIVAGSMVFGEYRFTDASISIPVSGAAMSEPVRNAARELAREGWIAFDGAGDVMLTPKGRADRRFLPRTNGILDVVPLARKELLEVTAVRPRQDGTVGVEFTWRWIPNEVGTAFTQGPEQERFAAQQRSTATLMHDGNEWSVITIRE